MEVVSIEKETFDKMMSELDALYEEMNLLYETYKEKSLEQWLDNQDVCNILSISKRTLQTYRDRGKLPYIQIEHKMYYRAKDVENLLNKTV